MGIREKAEVYVSAADLDMLDAQVGKQDPEQLDGLYGNEERPHADRGIATLQEQCGGGVRDGVRRRPRGGLRRSCTAATWTSHCP